MPNYSPIPTISVDELAVILADNPESYQLLDVRELSEVSIVNLPHFVVLPLSEFGEWSNQIQSKLDSQKETIVMCHHGIRSAQMCQWLISQGFTQVKNVSGGIDAYAYMVDDSLPRY
ncbi:MAG: rhodanese [Cyanobacterium sp. T60_A2020_053]|nr:rhodanese [Cyanobacterium sp. T60_A2020_053]